MSRLTRTLMLAVLGFLIVAEATPVEAGGAARGEAWWAFPPNPGVNTAGAGTMKVHLKMQGAATINSTIALAPGQAGTTVATNMARQICTDAVAAGQCPAPVGGCAGNFGVGQPCIVKCNGFEIRRPSPVCGNPIETARLQIGLPGIGAPGVIQACQLTRTDGGWNTVDLLDRVFLRVFPNGFNGVVTYKAIGPYSDPTSPPVLGSFTVNTTGKTDDQIVQAVCDGYVNLGLGIVANGHFGVSGNSSWADPGDIGQSGGSAGYVELHYPPTVSEFEVDTVAGQTLVMQTDAPQGAAVPALSEWGMAILVALLLVTSIWMLRRRQRLLSA